MNGERLALARWFVDAYHLHSDERGAMAGVIAELVAENARLRAALAHYADEANWVVGRYVCGCVDWIHETNGPDLARAALGQEATP